MWGVRASEGGVKGWRWEPAGVVVDILHRAAKFLWGSINNLRFFFGIWCLAT